MAPFLSSFTVLLIFIAFFSPLLFEGGISFEERAESPTQQDTRAHVNAHACVRERVCVQHVCAWGAYSLERGRTTFYWGFRFRGSLRSRIGLRCYWQGHRVGISRLVEKCKRTDPRNVNKCKQGSSAGRHAGKKHYI